MEPHFLSCVWSMRTTRDKELLQHEEFHSMRIIIRMRTNKRLVREIIGNVI